MGNSIDELRYTISLEQHLQYNHYPSVPISFVPACKTAIRLCAEGKTLKDLVLPNGKHISSGDLCDGLHLWPYVNDLTNEA